MEVLPADDTKQRVEKKLLRPEELIEQCLKSGGSLQSAARTLLIIKILGDNSMKYEASVSEGWGDEETLQQLSQIILFKASNRCYGLNAETIEDGFDQLLPLTQSSAEVAGLKDRVSSV
ncbi:hypothetical protein V6N13_045054 [Hibiscus sabdariffa]|uniref:Uncharacterized protein n=1 Tax=Hibiscus sabdariffa TaxID=183260 RepID=A0ABR2RK15_9ROSI